MSATRPKILVVDDSQISLSVTAMLLDEIDASIVTATSGEVAILKSIVEDFDLILMDVVMPGIDGFEAVKTIRKDERNKYIPIIFITATQVDEVQIKKGLSLGAVDFITKSISKELLRIKVKNLLELQKNRQELELTKRILEQKIRDLEIQNIEQSKAKRGNLKKPKEEYFSRH